MTRSARSRSPRRLPGAAGILLAALLFSGAALARDPDNWFGDPYFQVSRAIATCPEPRGPAITEAEALAESHHRAERGTRCHLEGRCRHPSSYDYDPEIAASIRAAIADGRMKLPRSSLWVLVQGRRVYVYGCVPADYPRGTLEKMLRAIPDVEIAIEQLRVGDRGATSYRVR